MISFTSEEENRRAIQRLTALWALSESGLGGLMFALKIPFTGFFLGAFAVIIISLIAHISNRDHKQIIQSVILVIMVKAMVSPHSPPPAYLAVAFQGLAGALLFRIKNFRVACILLGILSMVESAMQKIIMLTLVFGNNIWEAVNKFFGELKINFGLHNTAISSAMLIVSVYIILYAIWGMIIGFWASSIPASIQKHKEDLPAENFFPEESVSPARKKNNLQKRILVFVAMLIFIAAVFIFSGSGKQVLWIILRSLAAVALLYFVLRPLVKYWINLWLSNQTGRKQQANELILMLPQMRGYVSVAYRLAKQQRSVFARMKEFIIYLLSFALYGK